MGCRTKRYGPDVGTPRIQWRELLRLWRPGYWTLHLYQAWFGVYVVAGGKTKFQSGDETRDCQAAAKLGEYDQRSWDNFV